jgi:hypothetical protein
VDKAALLDRLGAEDRGEYIPYPWREPLVFSVTPTGWWIVGSRDFEIAGAERLAELSVGGEAVGCWLTDVAMASEARAFSDGQKVWAILHDCERSNELITEGDIPEAFAAIHAEARTEQEADDGEGPPTDYMFEVPQKVVEAICGFGPYIEPQPEMEFYRLTRPRPTLPGVLGKLSGWFGARVRK